MAEFEWDEKKNAANLAKHGIGLEEAVAIFQGPVLTGLDPGHHSEIRERTYGLLHGIVVVCIIHTERDGATRIISARKATRNERKLFNAALKKASH